MLRSDTLDLHTKTHHSAQTWVCSSLTTLGNLQCSRKDSSRCSGPKPRGEKSHQNESRRTKDPRAEGPGGNSTQRFSSFSRSGSSRVQVRSRGTAGSSLPRYVPPPWHCPLPALPPRCIPPSSSSLRPCPRTRISAVYRRPPLLSECHISFLWKQKSYTRSLRLDGPAAYCAIRSQWCSPAAWKPHRWPWSSSFSVRSVGQFSAADTNETSFNKTSVFSFCLH